MADDKQITKSQHWIPKFYLRGFIDKSFKQNKPQFWVYETKKALKDTSYIPKAQTPKKFASANYFYEVADAPNNAVENTLQTIEDKFAKICTKKILKKYSLTKEESLWVSMFIATLESRTVASKMNIDSFYDELISHIKQLEKVYNGGKETKTHKETQQIKESNVGFALMIAVSIEVNRWQFSDYQFLVIDDESDYFFITGNHPVCLYDMTYMNSFYGIAPMSPTIEVTVPLSPKLAMLINNAGIRGYRDLTHHLNYIEEINSRTIQNNTDFLVSSVKFDYTFLERTILRHRQSLILLNQREQLSKEFNEKCGLV